MDDAYSHFKGTSQIHRLHTAITVVFIYCTGTAKSHMLIAIEIHGRLLTSNTKITDRVMCGKLYTTHCSTCFIHNVMHDVIACVTVLYICTLVLRLCVVQCELIIGWIVVPCSVSVVFGHDSQHLFLGSLVKASQVAIKGGFHEESVVQFSVYYVRSKLPWRVRFI